MVRRVANQVHKQASRLLLSRYIKKEPAWFQAVLDNPPLPLPARAPPARNDYDLPPRQQTAARAVLTKRSRPLDPHPLPVSYLEDELRTQFFKDHPFEAFRPRTLLEDGAIEAEHPISGEKWTRLRQRGRNPSAEDAIRYAVNLHDYHGTPLNAAYASAVTQFRALRSEHQIASTIALREAEANGMDFGPSMVKKIYDIEEKAFESWKKTAEMDAAESTARKRWRMIVEKAGVKETWSQGQAYTRLWQEGIHPTYSPALAAPVITRAGLAAPPPANVTPAAPAETPAQAEARQWQSADFMRVTMGSRKAFP